MNLPIPTLSKPAWLLEQSRYEPRDIRHFETIFTLANGYAGVRGSCELDPLVGSPGLYVAGLFDAVGDGAREIVNLPGWLDVRANLAGFDLDPGKGEILAWRRTLDMRQGLLVTAVRYRDEGGRTTRWESARLLHMTRKHVGLIWGRITAEDHSGQCALSGGIDAWAVKYGSASGEPHFTGLSTKDLGDNGAGLQLTTSDGATTVAMTTRLEVRGARRDVRQHDDRIVERLSFPLEQGKPVSFVKHAAFATTRETRDPMRTARAELAASRKAGVTRMLRSHLNGWADLWNKVDIEIAGDERAQRALRFNLFHLASLARPGDDSVGIGAKGLHGNGYLGLSFWDTETYLMPFYTHCLPDAARALLGYRLRQLPETRRNARFAKMPGARYPFVTSDTAEDRSSIYGKQDHIQGDIAYAASQYLDATGDDGAFVDLARLIIETGLYWLGRLELDAKNDRYVMRDLMGPDEIHGNIDNNAYTNHLCAWHLRRAADLADELRSRRRWAPLRKGLGLSDADPDRWRQVADRIVTGYDTERGFHEQFEGLFRLRDDRPDRSMTQSKYTGEVLQALAKTQLSKQADTVLLYAMFHRDFSPAVRRKGWRYYEPRSTHASTLSRSIYALTAAREGWTERAYRLWLTAAEIDIGSIAENDTGIHAASLGGAWQAVVLGFAGLRVAESRLVVDPHLPRRWTKMSFRVHWRGSWLSVALTPGAVRLRAEGQPVEVEVGGRVHTVSQATKRIAAK